jgi:large subunit ribosomal protein L28
MSRSCEICHKGTLTGFNVPRKGVPKKKGGVGVHIGVKTKRIFKANLVTKYVPINGVIKKVRLCTQCLKTIYKDKV